MYVPRHFWVLSFFYKKVHKMDGILCMPQVCAFFLSQCQMMLNFKMSQLSWNVIFFSFIMYHVHILIRHRKSFCSISIIWWYKLLCLSLGSFRLISFARLSSSTFHSFVNVFNTTFFSFCVCWNTGSTTKCSICV